MKLHLLFSLNSQYFYFQETEEAHHFSFQMSVHDVPIRSGQLLVTNPSGELGPDESQASSGQARIREDLYRSYVDH